MAVSEIAVRGFKAACAEGRRFLTAPGAEGMLNRGFVLIAAVTLVTAWFSETFFFPDEHSQVLEFMAMKLGVSSPSTLLWEYGVKARPFTQPFFYYLIAKPLIALGLTDLFAVMTVLRFVTGALSLAALLAFAKLILGDLERDDEKRAFARMLPFMGFLPYLFVRTASETAAAAFFTLGLVLAVRAARTGTLPRMLAAGLLCGIAFECRYQSALLTAGLFGWLIFQARIRPAALAAFTAGGLAAVAFAALIDHWGYGVWCFPPWTYFDLNILQGIAAKGFGASPLLAYFYLEPATIFAPITALLMVAMVIACARNPRHVVTWATVPFFLVHCLMAHKEERFLFPLAILAISWPVLAFAPGRRFKVFDRLWTWRRSILAKIIGWSAVAAMLFLAVYPFGIRPHMKMAKYLYRNFPAGLVAYSLTTDQFTSYPMLRPHPYRVITLFGRADLETALAQGPVYLFSDTPTLPAALPPGVGARLLYSEFLFARTTAAQATKIMCAYSALPRRVPIHPPRLAFWTLFRLERGGVNDAVASPCISDWDAKKL
jgi:GPI mannosyltransferase 3